MAVAHITFENNEKIIQTLREHCENTAIYAQKELSTINLGELGYISGLLHDMGKGTEAFDAYIEKAVANEDAKRGSVNHTFTGVIFILEKYHNSIELEQMLTSEIVAYAIGAHHGLFDILSLEDESGFLHRLKKDKKSIFYQESCSYFLANIADEMEIDRHFQTAALEVRKFLEAIPGKQNRGYNRRMMAGFLSRLVLSAVIYADRRDTREFMCQKKDKDIFVDWVREQSAFEERISSFRSDSLLNTVRCNISSQCKKSALLPGGLYQLSVPTGGGKTLSSLRYALNHAAFHGRKRIIFVIPLLSILDQNAAVIKEYISNQEIVLEHHSNVVNEKNDKDELDDYELLTNTWDRPIVITTLVQLLNTMFSGKTSEVGRFRALADSVVIIDEVQTLPPKSICMFNRMVNFLTTFCNTTFVFSSATQPTFSGVEWPAQYAQSPELVILNNEQMKAFHRYEIVNCVDPYGMEIKELAAFGLDILKQHKALLIICNTKTEARLLFETISRTNDNPNRLIYHLSTSMCKSHRMEVLERIKESLSEVQRQDKESVKSVICISTQLVEAGIDFSFDAVVRVMAGLDNLAQAAGRCNRSNEYGTLGHVYLVKLKNESASLSHLPEIASAQNATTRTLQSPVKGDLIGKDAIKWFFKFKFMEMNKGNKKTLLYPVDFDGEIIKLAELLEKNQSLYADENKKFYLQQPFKYIGDKFSVFDDNTVDVIVPYKEGGEIIEEIKKLDSFHLPVSAALKLVNEAKAYAISLYEYECAELKNAGWITPLFDERIFTLSESLYRDDIGFSKEIIRNSFTIF